MNIIKQIGDLAVIDVRNTKYECNYQLIKITEEHSKGETVGVYMSKKDALQSLKDGFNS